MAFFVLNPSTTPFTRNRWCTDNYNSFTLDDLFANALYGNAFEPASSFYSPFACGRSFGWPKQKHQHCVSRRRFSPRKLQQRLANHDENRNNKSEIAQDQEMLAPFEGLFREILAPALQHQQENSNAKDNVDKNKKSFNELIAPLGGLFNEILAPAFQQQQEKTKAEKDSEMKQTSTNVSSEKPASDQGYSDSQTKSTNVVSTTATESAQLQKPEQSSVVACPTMPKQIEIDVQLFKPENVVVKLVDNRLLVEAQQEQRENGLYSRLELNRQFELGSEFDLNHIQCLYTKQGKLCIQIPRLAKKPEQKSEVVLPIQTEPQPMEQDEQVEQQKQTQNSAETVETSVNVVETSEKQSEKSTDEKQSSNDADPASMMDEDLD